MGGVRAHRDRGLTSGEPDALLQIHRHLGPSRAANRMLEGLLHDRPLPEIPTGEVPADLQPSPLPAPPSDEPEVILDGVETEEEDPALIEVNDWLSTMGLPEGQFLSEIQNPETGTPTAILDLAWPDGLQEGLSQPVTLLLDEGKDTLKAANASGSRYFRSVDGFRRCLQEEIRPGVG